MKSVFLSFLFLSVAAKADLGNWPEFLTPVNAALNFSEEVYPTYELSPDGKYIGRGIYTVGNEVLDAATGQTLYKFEGQDSEQGSGPVRFTNQGHAVAIFEAGHGVHTLELSTLTAKYFQTGFEVCSLEISRRDEQLMVSNLYLAHWPEGATAKITAIFDIQGNLLHMFNSFTDGYQVVGFNPTADGLIAYDNSSGEVIYLTETGVLQKRIKIRPEGRTVRTSTNAKIAFGELIVENSNDGDPGNPSVIIFQISSEKKLFFRFEDSFEQRYLPAINGVLEVISTGERNQYTYITMDGERRTSFYGAVDPGSEEYNFSGDVLIYRRTNKGDYLARNVLTDKVYAEKQEPFFIQDPNDEPGYGWMGRFVFIDTRHLFLRDYVGDVQLFSLNISERP